MSCLVVNSEKLATFLNKVFFSDFVVQILSNRRINVLDNRKDYIRTFWLDFTSDWYYQVKRSLKFMTNERFFLINNGSTQNSNSFPFKKNHKKHNIDRQFKLLTETAILRRDNWISIKSREILPWIIWSSTMSRASIGTEMIQCYKLRNCAVILSFFWSFYNHRGRSSFQEPIEKRTISETIDSTDITIFCSLCFCSLRGWLNRFFWKNEI